MMITGVTKPQLGATNISQNRSPREQEEFQVHQQLILRVADDGKLDAQEFSEMISAAQEQNYTELEETLNQWHELAKGQRGLTEADVNILATRSPKIAHLWARLSFAQNFYQNFLGVETGQPLIESPRLMREMLQDPACSGLNDESAILEEFYRLVAVLSSDLLNGRESGSLGENHAQQFLLYELAEVLPTWSAHLQPVAIPTWVSYDREEIFIELPGMGRNREDYNPPTPYIFSGGPPTVTAEIINLSTDWFFEKESGSTNLDNKIVILRPEAADFERTPPFDSLQAAQIAFAHGAKGVVLITDSAEWEYTAWPQDNSRRTYQQLQIPYFLQRPSRIRYWMNEALGFNQGQVLQLQGPVVSLLADSDSGLQLAHLNDGQSLTIHAQINWEFIEGHNLFVHSPATNGHEILIGAHLDHLGAESEPLQPTYGLTPDRLSRIAEMMEQRNQALIEGIPLFSEGYPVSYADLRRRLPRLSEEDYLHALKKYNFELDAIYNGAIDNASGVALALLLARRLHVTKADQNLSIAFFTGEEWGLHGSHALATHWDGYEPNRPLGLMLNLDMPSAYDPHYPDTLHYRITQAPNKFNLQDWLTSLNQDQFYHVNFVGNAYPREKLEERSDQASFAPLQSVSTVFLTGGFNTTYHSPKDEVNALDQFSDPQTLATLNVSEQLIQRWK